MIRTNERMLLVSLSHVLNYDCRLDKSKSMTVQIQVIKKLIAKVIKSFNFGVMDRTHYGQKCLKY